jgi:hypothetical protein
VGLCSRLLQAACRLEKLAVIATSRGRTSSYLATFSRGKKLGRGRRSGWVI